MKEEEFIKKSEPQAAAANVVGLEDVTRSVRALLRSTRNLGTASLEVLERELAMAISISEGIRDDIVSREALERVRSEGVMAKFRLDSHRVVDLALDAGSLAVNSGLEFLENFADRRRPPLAVDKNALRAKE
jgi:hypothetical protein